MGYFVVKNIKADCSVSVTFCPSLNEVPETVKKLKTGEDTDEQFLILEQKLTGKFYAFILAPQTKGCNWLRGPVDTEEKFTSLKSEALRFSMIQAVPHAFKNGQVVPEN